MGRTTRPRSGIEPDLRLIISGKRGQELQKKVRNDMARCLYTSWFSTFARKAALGLELKGLPYEAVDALAREFRPELVRVNPRAEVPVLLDDDLVVINSSDFLQYLDWRYPEPALYPVEINDRVAARALERLAINGLTRSWSTVPSGAGPTGQTSRRPDC